MKVLLFFLGMIGMFTYPPSLTAQEPTYTGEHIPRYEVFVDVQTDGRIQVREEITYDFGTDERHGIFRAIPYTIENEQGELYQMNIEGIAVTDEDGSDYLFNKTQTDSEISLKIGDPNKTISGVHTYIIGYRVAGALRYFEDVDELYWNAIGTDWDVPIAQAVVHVSLPSSITEASVQARCFVGSIAENTQCPVGISGYRSQYTATHLAVAEGMSIVTRFPSGVVAELEPQLVVSFWDTFLGKLTLLGIVIAAISWYILLPLWLPLKWWMHGRDPEHQGVGETSAWFDPPKTKEGRDLSAAETGVLIDEQANIKEITALIVQLAQKGYLTIVEKDKTNFELQKKKDFEKKQSLQPFEKDFLQELFRSGDVKNLKKHNSSMQTAVDTLQKQLYTQMSDEGFFPHNPHSVRTKYMILGGIGAATFNFPLLIMASIFGRIMPRKTLDGVHAMNVARSLRNFLDSQERQLNFQGDKQLMFEKLLPYAIAFGVEKQWAKRFEGVDMVQPEWYQSTHARVFTASTFTNSLHSSFQSSVNASATPVSSTGHSSGFSGGSVGGGGGGGGGGSW